MTKKRKTIRIKFPEEWRTFQHHPGPSEAVVSQKRSENSIFHGFQTQARSHEPIFGDRTLIFGVNITHWWGIENQNFGRDLNTLPFLRFLRKQMCATLVLPLGIVGSHERDIHLFFGKTKKRQSQWIATKCWITRIHI